MLTDKFLDGRKKRPGEGQTKDGRYYFRYTDSSGKRHTVYSNRLNGTDVQPKGGKIQKALRQIEAEIQDAQRRHIDAAAADKMTVADLVERYLKTRTGGKQGTIEVHKRVQRKINEGIGNRKIAGVRFSDVKAYYSELLEKYSYSTVSGINAVLSPAFDLAVKDDILTKNPARGALSDLKKTADKPAPRVALTVEQEKHFLDAVQKSKALTASGYGNLFTFLLFTGCRIGEALALRWSDVDFKNKEIHVSLNLQYTEGKHRAYITTPKTAAGVRVIPLVLQARKALTREKERQLKTGIRNTDTVDGYSGFIFVNLTGHCMCRENCNLSLSKFLDRANKAETAAAEKDGREPDIIPHISVHNFRHTFCTRLCEYEPNLAVVMAIMGHDDIKTTMSVYNDVQGKFLSEHFKKMTEAENLFEMA